jgi:uncharacterized protein involved in type VI secretion and phage assembly
MSDPNADPGRFDHRGPLRRLHGIYNALVTDIVDPEGQGRIQVTFPWLAEDDTALALWARLSTPMAGGDRGYWQIPEVDEEVLVAFIAGDPGQPVVVGSVWNGVDQPPEQMDEAGENNLRSFTSRSGHRLTFDDSSGSELVSLTSQGGHQVVLDDGDGSITIEHQGGSLIKIDSAGTITFEATNRVEVQAPSGMSVTTSTLTVDAPMSRFSGVVNCDTLITNAVISSSYTPGAGNVW